MPSKHRTTLTIPLPANQTPYALVDALHSHDPVVKHQEFIQSWTKVPSSELAIPAHVAPFFAPATDAPIVTYQVAEAIPIVPGIGSAGTYTIQFPAAFQDTVNGLRVWSVAPMGVEVKNVWTIHGTDPHRRAQRLSVDDFVRLRDRPDEARYYEWTLFEECEVSCSGMLMPFVKSRLEAGHRNICRKMMEDAGYVVEDA
jgi:hypothetical protein